MSFAKCLNTRRFLANTFLRAPTSRFVFQLTPAFSRNTPLLPRLLHTIRTPTTPPILFRSSSFFAKSYTTAIAADAVASIPPAVAKTATMMTTHPVVGYWLYFNAAMTFTIVVVGGLTRLTESGLSITEWNVISGMKPPRSQQEWEEEFEKYKQFPEYKM